MDDERIRIIKEKEIKRLTSPLNYTKGTWTAPSAVYDCEGNEVDPINTFNGKKYFVEPKPGILSDDEVLIYAPQSKEASRIRLKRGEGKFSDKILLYGNIFYLFAIPIILVWLPAFSLELWILLIIIPVFIIIYIFFLHNFKEKTTRSTVEFKHSDGDELLLLFESKEKIAREMIEKKFPAPQMTNTKFNSVLDNCKKVVESQIEILNVIVPTDKTKYEISSRKKLIKQVISKVDDLTNELILSEESKLDSVIDEMDKLISTIKDYE